MSETADAYGAPQPTVRLDQVLRPLHPFVPWLTLLAVLYLVFTILGQVAIQWWGPMLTGTIGFLTYPVSIGLFIVGGLYFHHAGQNADQLGAQDRTWAPYWGFVSWIIPAANAILPWLYVSEVWRASHPQAGPLDWRERRVPGWMVLWWAAWGGAAALAVVGFIAGIIIGIGQSVEAVRQGPGTVPDTTMPTWFLALNWSRLVLIVVALPFFIRLIRALADRQQDRARRMIALQEKDGSAPSTGTF